MPKDDWAKANARDVARKAPGGLRGKPGKGGKRRKRGRHHKLKHNRTGAYSGKMKMWFGKYKDKALKDVPESYLRWLAGQAPANSWQINALCDHLREMFSALQLATDGRSTIR